MYANAMNPGCNCCGGSFNLCTCAVPSSTLIFTYVSGTAWFGPSPYTLTYQTVPAPMNVTGYGVGDPGAITTWWGSFVLSGTTWYSKVYCDTNTGLPVMSTYIPRTPPLGPLPEGSYLWNGFTGPLANTCSPLALTHMVPGSIRFGTIFP
jgi:hypothetical protein